MTKTPPDKKPHLGKWLQENMPKLDSELELPDRNDSAHKRYDRPLTPEEMAARPDSEIDTSDIPEFDEAFWSGAKLNPPRIKSKPE